MTSPREQAIEEAAKAIYTKSGRIGWDGQLEVHKRIWLDQAREYITAYESARARIDGAKMMPREVSDAQRIAAVNTTLPGIGEPPLYEKLFHAMHDATPKDGER